jgi:hypothetical protein
MSAPLYTCPKCKGSDFKLWKLPHPLIMHWVLNPAVVFNEVALGQRVPKLQLICQTCEGPLMERAYVPCPTCRHMHWGRLWKRTRAFGNWRGISCPACGTAIPCLWNVFSLLILAVTSPIWALPYFLHFRAKPLRQMYEVVEGLPPVPAAVTRKTWIFMGAGWGALMWVLMSLLPALRSSGEEGTSWRLAVGLPVWALAGFAFGFFMWLFLGRRPRRGEKGEPPASPRGSMSSPLR